MKPKITALLFAVLFATSIPAVATETCDKGSYSDIWNFCFDSVFPVRYAGNDMGSPDDEIGAPPGAHTTSNAWCKCGEDPYAYYGTASGYWEPARIVEVVRHPECSPTQGTQAEAQLKMLNQSVGKMVRKAEGSQSKLGNIGGTLQDTYNKYGSETFLHFHSWPVPDEILDIVDSLAMPNGRTLCADMARNASNNLETSITSLPWNASGSNRLLMNIYHPEYYWALDPIEGNKNFGSAVNSLLSVFRPISCTINTTGVGVNIDDYAYMLGGCFPDTLPTNGHHNEDNTLTATHSILQKSLIHSHSTGGYASLSTVHEGNDQVLCSPMPAIGFPRKSHYKFTMLFPYKESEESDSDDNDGNGQKSTDLMKEGKDGLNSSMTSIFSNKFTEEVQGQVMDWLGVGKTKCAHRFGASKTQWGASRHSQGDENAKYEEITSKKDHDAVYMVWRWVDCCWE